MTKKTNPHWGTTLDECLAEEGTREAAKVEALTRVVAWQLTQEWSGKASARLCLPSACIRAAPKSTAS